MSDNVFTFEETPEIIDFRDIKIESPNYDSLLNLYIDGAKSVGSTLFRRSDNPLYKAADRIFKRPIDAFYKRNLNAIIGGCISGSLVGLAYTTRTGYDNRFSGYLYARVNDGTATVVDMYPHNADIIKPLLKELHDRGATKIIILPAGDSEEYNAFLKELNTFLEGIKNIDHQL